MPLRRAFAGEESLRWALAKGQKLQVRLWLATADGTHAPAQVNLLRSGGPAAPRRASRTQAGLPHSAPPLLTWATRRLHGVRARRALFAGPFLLHSSLLFPLPLARSTDGARVGRADGQALGLIGEAEADGEAEDRAQVMVRTMGTMGTMGTGGHHGHRHEQQLEQQQLGL
jgi:hypothetical protein